MRKGAVKLVFYFSQQQQGRPFFDKYNFILQMFNPSLAFHSLPSSAAKTDKYRGGLIHLATVTRPLR